MNINELSKEDREELLNQKIAKIRLKNEEIQKRHAEIEADKKNANVIHKNYSTATNKKKQSNVEPEVGSFISCGRGKRLSNFVDRNSQQILSMNNQKQYASHDLHSLRKPVKTNYQQYETPQSRSLRKPNLHTSSKSNNKHEDVEGKFSPNFMENETAEKSDSTTRCKRLVDASDHGIRITRDFSQSGEKQFPFKSNRNRSNRKFYSEHDDRCVEFDDSNESSENHINTNSSHFKPQNRLHQNKNSELSKSSVSQAAVKSSSSDFSAKCKADFSLDKKNENEKIVDDSEEIANDDDDEWEDVSSDEEEILPISKQKLLSKTQKEYTKLCFD